MNVKIFVVWLTHFSLSACGVVLRAHSATRSNSTALGESHPSSYQKIEENARAKAFGKTLGRAIGSELARSAAEDDTRDSATSVDSEYSEARELRHSSPQSSEVQDRTVSDSHWLEAYLHDGALRFSSKQQSGHNVTIASMFIGNNLQSWFAVQKNHIAFSQMHGYNYFAPWRDDSFVYGSFSRAKRHPTWSKMAIIQYLFDSGSDAVFWIDADSVFMNGEDNIAAFMSLGQDLVFSGDHNVVFNAGHFLLRKSDWSKHFLREAYGVCPAPGEWMDNSAMLVVLGGGTAKEPGGWNPALSRMVAKCRSEWETLVCQSLIHEDIRKHVQNLQQDAMNTYAKLDRIENLAKSQLPFLIHKVHTSDRSELPPLAAVGVPQLQPSDKQKRDMQFSQAVPSTRFLASKSVSMEQKSKLNVHGSSQQKWDPLTC